MLSGRELALQSYKRKQQQEFSDALPMPDMGTSQSTAQVGNGGPDLFIGNLPKTIIQGTARGAFATGQILAGAGMGMTPAEVNKVAFKPESGAKIWLGEEEVGLATEGTDILTGFGVPEKWAVNSAPFLIAGLTALDVSTGGGKEGLIKSFVKATDEAVISKGLRTMKFSEDVVEEYAPLFAKATKEEEVAQLIADAAKAESVFTTELKVADGASVITPAGKVFSESVENVRSRLQTIFKKTDEAELGGTKKIVEDALKVEAPTIKQLRLATDALQVAGAKVDDIVKDIADITDTVKMDVERFGSDVVKTSTEPIATEPNIIKADVESKPLDPNAPPKIDDTVLQQPGIFKPESREVFKGAVKTKENATLLREKYVDRLVDVNEEIAQKGGKAEAPTALMTEKADLTNGIKAIDDVVEELPKQADLVKTAEQTPTGITKVADDLKPKLEEVANPVKEKLGMLSVNVQERYGKAAVTKSKAEKFKVAENKVFHQILRYAEEAAYVAENGGEMVQKMPSWVPEELRDVTVFDHVIGLLQRGEIPASHASREMALYTKMVDETARLAGIKTAPKGAVNPEGAIMESMRARTRTEGSKTNPLVKSDSKSASEEIGKVDEANMFEEADDAAYIADYHSQEEALAAYNKFEAEKYSRPAPIRGKGKKGGQVNEKKPYGIDLSKLTDISKFKAGFRDIYRNSERFFGEQWPIVKEKFFDPFDAAKGRMVDEEQKLLTGLKTNVVDKFGIKKGSKESAAVMDFGERQIDYDTLVKRFGEVKAGNIKDAALWLRGEYDRMIDELNVIEAKIYPNNPSKITPKRQDYFRHFEEMSEGWTGFKNAFEDPTLSNLPPGFKTEDSKGAKSKWQSFKQERLGWRSKRDAIGGFLNYVPNYVYSKHIDPQTATFRNFTKDLRGAVNEGDESIANYIEGIESWTDDLAGQANVMDRFTERFVPGGRKAINVLDFMNKRAKRNAILGNVGASVSQAFNVPGAIASAGPINSTRGFVRSIGDVIGYGDRPSIVNESPFIKERYRHSAYDQFNVGMLEHTKEFASWMLGVLDEVGTKFAWNAHYEKALKDGVTDPIKFADDFTRKSVAGRGVGEVPIVQKSKTFQMVAPFQLEVMNQWYLMREFLDEKAFGKFATLFVAYTIFNEGAEEIKGSRVGFDPLMAIYDSYNIAIDDTVDEDGTEVTMGEKAKKIAGRMGGEVLSNIPLGSYATTGISAIAGMDEKEREEFFGQADPVRFGNAPLLWNAVKDPLFGLMPAWGGAQMEKTWGGIKALATGKVKDKDGNVIMGVEPGVTGVLQNVLFGQYAPNFEYKDSVETEMRALFKENMRLKEAGNEEAVKANIMDLAEPVRTVYVDMAKQEIAAERNRQKVAMRPTYDIVSALVREGKTEEAKKISNAMTPKEKELYRELHKDVIAQKKAEATEQEVIETAINYAYAFGTNPIQAFEIVFKNHEIIKDTVGGSFDGLVITKRVHFEGEGGSDEIKEKLMEEQGITNKESVKLEHKLPLTLGGSNQLSNLELRTTAEHDASTKMEAYLGEAVKYKKISFKDAQILILRYKGYEGESISDVEIRKMIGRIPAYNASKKEKEAAGIHKGLDDHLREFLFEDEDEEIKTIVNSQ